MCALVKLLLAIIRMDFTFYVLNKCTAVIIYEEDCEEFEAVLVAMFFCTKSNPNLTL